MLTFKSSKHLLVLVTLWLVVAVLLVIPFLPNETENTRTFEFIGFFILYLISGMLVWILVDTKYKIQQNKLFYYSGPIRGKIEISNIRKIEYWNKWYSNSFLKPALGKDGLVIYYDKFDDIYISPKDKDGFIAALREINPGIQVV